MKGAIYARESSADTNMAPPIEGQIEIGKKWFTDNKHELLEIYKDNGWSGGDWRRPDWNRMVVEARKFDFIWTWGQDRLARDVEQFRWLYRNLREKQCHVYAGTDEIDMDTVGGIAKHTSLAMADEIMRVQTSEKVKRVYAHKKAQADLKHESVRWGRTNIPEEIRLKVLELARGDPRPSIRQIVLQLPTYRLISKPSPTYRQPSVGWVCTVLKEAAKLPSVQKSPLNFTEEKPSRKRTVQYNPIDEQQVQPYVPEGICAHCGVVNEVLQAEYEKDPRAAKLRLTFSGWLEATGHKGHDYRRPKKLKP